MVSKRVSENSGDNGDNGDCPQPKRRCVQSKYWAFTWNNYPEDWGSFLERSAPDLNFWVAGKEVAPSTGTPHLQGYLEAVERLRPTELGWPPQIHWEKARGSRAANVKYCTKEGDWESSHPLDVQREVAAKESLRLIQSLRPWQQEVVDLVSQVPDERTIHWYWEPDGGVGKSSLVKLLCAKHGALVCAGKAADMKHMVAERCKRQRPPIVVIFDIPRSSLGYLSYTGIEEIKNGCFASTKYESGMVVMNSPHVLVFANHEPDYQAMSLDRWKVVRIQN